MKKNPATADDAIIAFLERQGGETQVWPRDVDVRESLRTLPLYVALPRARVRLILEGIEQSMRSDLTEQIQADSVLRIEHLVPQSWKAHWPLAGEIEPEVGELNRDRAKHSSGNLTLVTGKLNPAQFVAALSDSHHTSRSYPVATAAPSCRDDESYDANCFTFLAQSPRAFSWISRPYLDNVQDLS